MNDRNTDALQAVLPDVPTDALATLRSTTRIHLHAEGPAQGSPPWAMTDRAAQIEVAANLLGRLFPGNLSADGFVSPDLGLVPSTSPLPAPAVVLAFSDVAIAARWPGVPVVYVDSRGYTAFLSTAGPCSFPRVSSNRLGAFYAGARAAGEAFNRVLAPHHARTQVVDGTHTHDLVTHATNAAPNYEPDLTNRPVILRDVGIVGVGAVGQALACALSLTPDLRGNIHLIDPQGTDESNEGRYILSSKKNRGQFKTTIAADRLRVGRGPLLTVVENLIVPTVVQAQIALASGLQAQFPPVVSTTAVDFKVVQQACRRERPFDIAVTTVDTASVRVDIQMSLPRLALNGWTATDESGMHFGIGRHAIDGNDQCVACFYHEPETEMPDEVRFVARITGLPVQQVEQLLASGAPVSEETAREVGRRRHLDDAALRKLAGRPLLEFIHGQCGVATVELGGRTETSPVPHVPALVGAHLAAQIVLESLGETSVVRNLAIFDAFRLPGPGALSFRRKVDGCLCRDADVLDVFRRLWTT